MKVRKYNDTITFRLNKDTKKRFIDLCQDLSFEYSGVMRALIEYFKNDKQRERVIKILKREVEKNGNR